MMSKIASADHPIHELIARRWSPYAFDSRGVSTKDLQSLFEALRWSASSYNEQPWSYIVATKEQPEEHARLLSCLVEGNQAWAAAAPVLVLCCCRPKFTRNNKPNAAAEHDLGLAAGNLCLEATARGLHVHQMIGIEPDKARQVYRVPEDFTPKTAMAIGYAADPDNLPEKLKERDTAPRRRKPLAEFLYQGQWGQAADLAKK